MVPYQIILSFSPNYLKSYLLPDMLSQLNIDRHSNNHTSPKFQVHNHYKIKLFINIFTLFLLLHKPVSVTDQTSMISGPSVFGIDTRFQMG